ncbi:hypothetical protein GCM10009757_20040 [Streptomyces cheonanensis]|uniref:Uncharacterized protein n=1 Tax=Streptomyces cheonanensis TaxID=312720 RepID=A0ABN2V328_9ACTN
MAFPLATGPDPAAGASPGRRGTQHRRPALPPVLTAEALAAASPSRRPGPLSVSAPRPAAPVPAPGAPHTPHEQLVSIP